MRSSFVPAIKYLIRTTNITTIGKYFNTNSGLHIDIIQIIFFTSEYLIEVCCYCLTVYAVMVIVPFNCEAL